MKIAMVTVSHHCGAMAGWIAENNINTAELMRWHIDPMPDVAEQVLDALVAQWLHTPADIVIFPAGALGDELATRLAWRLQGGSICQVLTLNPQDGSVTKSHWGNALRVTLEVTARPLCLSLARQPEMHASHHFPLEPITHDIVPTVPPDWLVSVESVDRISTHPLLHADHVLVVGQGGSNTDEEAIAVLGQALRAEVGYSRARVMNGGFDAGRVVGISGHLLAPDVCIVAGASGAAALMAGISQSQFIIAINHDSKAPVFSQADVGIVDDWLPVLEALIACATT